MEDLGRDEFMWEDLEVVELSECPPTPTAPPLPHLTLLI